MQALKGAGYEINYLPIDLRTFLGFLAYVVGLMLMAAVLNHLDPNRSILCTTAGVLWPV